MNLRRVSTFAAVLLAVALLPSAAEQPRAAAAAANHPGEARPSINDYPVMSPPAHVLWPTDQMPGPRLANGTRAAAPTAVAAGPNAFLTRPYWNYHSVTSVFDHCNPDYSIDGKICEVDGTVALKTNGVDPYFPKGYAVTKGQKDYLYYDGHNGWDLSLNYEPLLAAAPGVITYADWDVPGCTTCGYGRTVIIDHGNGFSTRYGHMSSFDPGIVNGATVYRGQEIGISGNTGSSSGPHLHFSVYVNSTWVAIDPWGWEGAPGADPWPADQGNLWATGNPINPVPGPPTNVTAEQHPSSAVISWTPPVWQGGGMSACVATSSPGNITASVAQPGPSSVTMKGLTNGTAYTFTVICATQAGLGDNSAPSNSVTPVPTIPDPPKSLTAQAGNQHAVVSWQAPAFDGQSPITGYRVTPVVNGQPQPPVVTADPSTSTTVSGLPDGAPVTFTVAAINAVGPSADAPAPSNPVIPIAGGKYVPVQPARILDTRNGGSPLGRGQTMNLQVAGAPGSGVPATGVSAVMLNVTATDTTGGSYLTVYPTGVPRPTASNLNWTAGQTVPDAVEVALGTGGQISLYNYSGSANVVVDVAGYVLAPAQSATTDGVFNPVTPFRVLDTRAGSQVGPYNAPLQPQGVVRAQVAGVAGSAVPATGASAVVLNVTATNTSFAGFLSVWPDGAPQPTASSLNWVAGQTTANQVVVKVGPGGNIELFNNSGTTDVVIDVQGWFTDTSSTAGGTGFVGVTPCRLLDSRDPGGHALTGDSALTLQVAGFCAVPVMGTPASPKAVVLSVTATGTTADSYFTVWADGTPRPLASSLNWRKGQTVPNLVVVPIGAGGAVDIYNRGGNADVVVDVVGWYG